MTTSPNAKRKSWRDWLPIHPRADRLPLLPADKLQAMADDIKKPGGLRQSAVFWRRPSDGEPELLDGRNRLDALELNGEEITLDNNLIFDEMPSDIDAVAYIVSVNIHRRHLTAEERQNLLIELIARAPAKSDRQHGKDIGVDHKTIALARAKGEDVGSIPHVEKRKDTQGRKQPAHKAAPKPAPDVPKPPEHRPVPGVACHPRADRGDDLYETPACAIRALLKAEQINGPIWEPACGPGAIVTMLRAAGHCVIATDLVDRGCPDSTGGVNFLEQQSAPDADVALVLTNPPYRHANKFVRHALTLAPRVVMLLPLRFLEGVRRSDILDNGTLARVHVFKNRLPMMHRAGWQGRRASSQLAFAWFVWDRAHRGPAQLHRISWAPADDAEPAASPPSLEERATRTRAAHSARTQRAAKPPRPQRQPRPPSAKLVKIIADRAQARADATAPPPQSSAPADDPWEIPHDCRRAGAKAVRP